MPSDQEELNKLQKLTEKLKSSHCVLCGHKLFPTAYIINAARGNIVDELNHYHDDGFEIINSYVKGVNAYINEINFDISKNPPAAIPLVLDEIPAIAFLATDKSPNLFAYRE